MAELAVGQVEGVGGRDQVHGVGVLHRDNGAELTGEHRLAGVMASPPMVALMVSGVVLPSRNLACLSMALNSASFRVLAVVSVAA